jgi:hypothetical protein
MLLVGTTGVAAIEKNLFRGHEVSIPLLNVSSGNLLVDAFEVAIAFCSVWITTSEIMRRKSGR